MQVFKYKKNSKKKFYVVTYMWPTFNHKIYLSDLPVLLMVTVFYRSKLPLLFMVNNFNCIFFGVELFLTITSKSDQEK